MPYKIKKVKGGYSTSGPSGVHAKKTSLKKAKAQVRLMQGVNTDGNQREEEEK